MKKYLLFFVLCAASTFAIPRLWTGTYALSGGTGKWSGTAYHGEVKITPQGDNFQFNWTLNSGRTLTGIGILNLDIMSVAFVDSRTGSWGVASYRVIDDGELEGYWSYSQDSEQKPEYLIWKGY